MDVFELNEAFAAQSLAVIRDLGVNPDKVWLHVRDSCHIDSVGECERWGHSSRSPHWSQWLSYPGHSPPHHGHQRSQERCGRPLYRWRDGHSRVCRDSLVATSVYNFIFRDMHMIELLTNKI